MNIDLAPVLSALVGLIVTGVIIAILPAILRIVGLGKSATENMLTLVNAALIVFAIVWFVFRPIAYYLSALHF